VTAETQVPLLAKPGRAFFRLQVSGLPVMPSSTRSGYSPLGKSGTQLPPTLGAFIPQFLVQCFINHVKKLQDALALIPVGTPAHE